MLYEITRWAFLSLHMFHFYLRLFTQSLTTLQLQDNGIGNKGAQYLADALRNNTVKRFSLFISLISNYIVLYRHSPHSSSHRILSVPKEPNISLMLYKTIWWVSFSLHVSLSFSSLIFTQTLTTLEISSNRIGDKGIQYLADALENNTVSLVVRSSLSFLCRSLIQTLKTLDLSYNSTTSKAGKQAVEILKKKIGLDVKI
jgi:Ran GTPase-activating protein (RanGAP) involved in mRNA processing and transport